MRPERSRFVGALLAVASLCFACGPGRAPSEEGLAPAGSGSILSATPKSMVVGLSSEPLTLGPFQVGGQSHQGPVYQVVHDFLVVHSDQGEGIAHLAEERPSVAKGTWKVFPDGTMETTWRLRKGARWHDGSEFTARDMVFAWRIANDSEVPWSRPALARLIRDIDTPDPHTLVMRWSRTFPFADNPEETTLDPLAAHILEPIYAADVQGLVNSPYWTREFVGLGPYKIASWEPGSHMELRAVEDHYAGRSKLGAVTVRFVTDPNTLMANILSGAVDINMPPTNLTHQHWNTIREQWRDGEVIQNLSGTFGFVAPNHRVPPFGDVQVRRALAHAIDRVAVVDAQLIPRSLITDGMVVPGSEKAKRLKDKIQVYDYDPPRAQMLLEGSGWRRGADGMVRNTVGQPFEFEYRAGRSTEAQVVADLWKAIGLQPNIVLPSPALTADLEYQASVKGVESSGFGIGFGMWERRMHSSAIPTAQTRWAGTNRRYYSNPEVDALIDRFVTTLDEGAREEIEGDLLQRVTREAVLAPLYVNSPASVVRKGITGLKPMAGSPIIVANYYNTWNILEWDR